MTKQEKRLRYRAQVKARAPYTRGRALIDVRTMQGPNGYVRHIPNCGQQFQVGTMNPDGFVVIRGYGDKSWREAVQSLRRYLDEQYKSQVKVA